VLIPSSPRHNRNQGVDGLVQTNNRAISFALICAAVLAPAQTSRRDKARVAAEDHALDMIAEVAKKANRVIVVEYRVSGPFMLPNTRQIREAHGKILRRFDRNQFSPIIAAEAASPVRDLLS
jgi:hypothetical protein